MSENLGPKVFFGGLMRCCTGTLVAMVDSAELPEEEGHVVNCRYCGAGMIYRDGAYRWSPEHSREPP